MDTKNINKRLEAIFRYRKVELRYEFNHIESAVFLPLIDTEEGTEILFEVRSSKLNWQPGEVCFPGGKVEKSDKSSMHAAIRETCEELQIPEENIIVYGQLDSFYSQLGIMAYPYVGKIKEHNCIKPSAGEVEKVFTVPLEFLLKTTPEEVEMELVTRTISNNFPKELIKDYKEGYVRRKNYKLYFYRYKEFIIWGFTARILKNFLDIYKDKFTS